MSYALLLALYIQSTDARNKELKMLVMYQSAFAAFPLLFAVVDAKLAPLP